MGGLKSGAAAQAHAHAVSFYDSDHDLARIVARYVAEGLGAGERVVLVLTPLHAAAIDLELSRRDLDPVASRLAGDLVVWDAATALATFFVDDELDAEAFGTRVRGVLDDPRHQGREVRFFGEMVALLWAVGDVSAALELEQRWNDLLSERPFELLCAYPASSLGSAGLAEVEQVCGLHGSIGGPASYQYPARGTSYADNEEAGVFVPVPEAVSAARHFITSVLHAWGEEDILWDAAVVTSELATNALHHGASPFRASLSRAGGVVRLGIEDAGPGWPRQLPASRDSADGRGVAIVRALADRSGCDMVPGGKVAWAEFGRAARVG